MERQGLKILQIISSSATSGAERHVLSLSKLLIERGHSVEVICPSGGWLAEGLREKGINVHETEMKGRGWFKTTAYVMRRMRSEQIDLVHSHLTRATYFGAVSGLLCRVPAISTVHVANHDQVYKRMARGQNKLIAVSNYVKGMLHGRGIRDQFIETVYNGTDFQDIGATPASDVKREFGIPDDSRIIGLVGRVCREKGHPLMLDAMRKIAREHPNAHLMMVGRIEPGFEPEMRQIVGDAGLQDRLTFTGVRHDVPRLIDACEFTAMPSHQETFGVAAIEAMARGKAVIASKVGGLPEVVRHRQTGLLVDLRSESIAEASNYLLSNALESEQMGAQGKSIVQQKFTLRHMVDRVEAVYGQAAAY